MPRGGSRSSKDVEHAVTPFCPRHVMVKFTQGCTTEGCQIKAKWGAIFSVKKNYIITKIYQGYQKRSADRDHMREEVVSVFTSNDNINDCYKLVASEFGTQKDVKLCEEADSERLRTLTRSGRVKKKKSVSGKGEADSNGEAPTDPVIQASDYIQEHKPSTTLMVWIMRAQNKDFLSSESFKNLSCLCIYYPYDLHFNHVMDILISSVTSNNKALWEGSGPKQLNEICEELNINKLFV
ncbi:G-protein coupled receptor [Acrasis kona]|uniref:G-protein coupled receptor n=1 Tax=Acrasis kona TaxID=1008807 RepID=A0AAW2Z2H3_9EUKA